MIEFRPTGDHVAAPRRAGQTMKVYINDIVVKDRYRKDKGDIEGLMKSIDEIGLLQPIGITKDNILVFGERRLTACFALGWSEIEARVVDLSSIVEGEFAENEVRKAFTPSERLAIAEAVEREVGRRQGSRNDVISFSERKKELVGERPQVNDGEKTRDFAAKAAGFTSEKQRRRTEKIVKDGDPTLIEAVDKGDVAITKAADIANLTKPEQIVSLAGEKADREAREGAESALLQEVAQHKLYHPANAYTDYIEKHKKRPDRETAAGIGKLLGTQVKADDGTMQPPKSKAQKQTDREERALKKERDALRAQAYRAYISVCYLGQNQDDPKDLVHLIDRWEMPHMLENFERAVEWFNRFAKEWRDYASKNNLK